MRRRSLSCGVAAALVLSMFAAGPAVGQLREPAESAARAEPTMLKATARNRGVRLVLKVQGPLVVGVPATIRARVQNKGSSPILWSAGPYGVRLRATMPDAVRRMGQPLERLRPGRGDLKNTLFGGSTPRNRKVDLPFRVHRVAGLETLHTGGPAAAPERIDRGEEIGIVYRWDGFLHLSDESPGHLGLPPDGGLRVTATARYEDPSFPGGGRYRTVTTRIETEVVGGWSDDRLHPMEVVDAALADPEAYELIGHHGYGRQNGILMWNEEEGLWLVGSCGRREDGQRFRWRLAAVDPFSAEVVRLTDGLGTKDCMDGPPR